MGFVSKLFGGGRPSNKELVATLMDAVDQRLRQRSSAIQTAAAGIRRDGVETDAGRQLGKLFHEVFGEACDDLGECYPKVVARAAQQWPAAMSPRADVLLGLPTEDLEAEARRRLAEVGGLETADVSAAVDYAAQQAGRESAERLAAEVGMTQERHEEVTRFVLAHVFGNGMSTEELIEKAQEEGLELEEVRAVLEEIQKLGPG